MNHSKLWGRLDRAMSSLHPQRGLISTLVDGATVLLCWHLTYLFRLGFERYQPGRPWYDDYVSFGVVAAYMLCLALLGVPRGIWRYFGFDDLKRITLACLSAGVVSAAAVSTAQLVGVARAVLLLHPLPSHTPPIVPIRQSLTIHQCTDLLKSDLRCPVIQNTQKVFWSGLSRYCG